MLVRFDQIAHSSANEVFAYSVLEKQIPDCPAFLMKALYETIQADVLTCWKQVALQELESGMVLGEDVKLNDGRMVLSKGTEMTPHLIDRLRLLVGQGVCKTESVCVVSRE